MEEGLRCHRALGPLFFHQVAARSSSGVAVPLPAPLAGSATPPAAGHLPAQRGPRELSTLPQRRGARLTVGPPGRETKCPRPRPAMRVTTSFLPDV